MIGAAGLAPLLRLAERAGLAALADERPSVPTDKGAYAGAKVSVLVAGMVAGADSIEDTALLRHGGMGRLFDHCYAPSTLESFLRTVYASSRDPRNNHMTKRGVPVEGPAGTSNDTVSERSIDHTQG